MMSIGKILEGKGKGEKKRWVLISQKMRHPLARVRQRGCLKMAPTGYSKAEGACKSGTHQSVTR